MSSAARPHCFMGAVVVALAFLFCGILSPQQPLTDTSSEVCDGTDSLQVDQVVMVLVDALRPDFVLRRLSAVAQGGGDCPPGGIPSSDGIPYAGATLTYIEDALVATASTFAPADAVGAFFIADSPTTTSQRLRALTTGVVPAFVEAGNNFWSDAVSEDSVIRQLNGSAVVLGDDTWLSLYPSDHWRESHVLPSFHVSDLDSNDELVASQLADVLYRHDPHGNRCTGKEMKEQHPARLILAHLLGVDHAGHTFHASHAEMSRKLAQTDVVLRSASRVLRERTRNNESCAESRFRGRTLLLVFGDHGMDNSGNHGGMSPQETDSFFFAQLFSDGEVYVPATAAELQSDGKRASQRQRMDERITQRWSKCHDEAVDLCRLRRCCDGALPNRPCSLTAFRQVDLVPTLAILLGISIPFSSTGRVVPELLELVRTDGSADSIDAAEDAALRCNVAQLTRLCQARHVGVNLSHVAGLECTAREVLDFDCAGRIGGALREHVMQPSRTAIAIGALLLAAAFTALANRATAAASRLRVAPGSAVLIFALRCALIFSNSFVVLEPLVVEALTASVILLRALFVPGARWRPVVVSLVVLKALRLGWRPRRHGTHVIDPFSSGVDAGAARLVDAVVFGLESVWSGLVSSSSVSLVLRTVCRCGVAFAIDAPCVSPTVLGLATAAWGITALLVGTHTATAVGLAAAFVAGRGSFPRRGSRNCTFSLVSLWLWTLWCGELCGGENLTWSLMPQLHVWLLASTESNATDEASEKGRRHTVSKALLIHLFSACIFFGSGQQMSLVSVDWTSSTVGESSDLLLRLAETGGTDALPLWWKGCLVAARTFFPWFLQGAWATVRLSDVEAEWFLFFGSTYASLTVAAVALFRDHLMLVAIFAPKGVFDILALGATWLGGVTAVLFRVEGA